MNSLVRVLLILTLCLILALAAAATGVHLYLRTEQGGARALAALNDLLPGTFEAHSVSLSLFRQKVTLSSVVLREPFGTEVIRADEITVRIDLFALLHQKVLLTGIHLGKPLVTLAYDSKGNLTLISSFVGTGTPEAAPGQKPEQKPEQESEQKSEDKAEQEAEPPREPPSEAAWSVVIEGFTCSEGRLVSQIGPGGLRVVMEKLDLSAGADFSEMDLWWKARAASGEITLPDQVVLVNETSVQGRLHGESLTDLVLSMETGLSRVTVTGDIRDLTGDLRLDLASELSLASQDLGWVPGLPDPLTGSLKAELTIRGSPDNPDLTLAAAYTGGLVADWSLGSTALKLALKDRVLQVHALETGIASGTIGLTGKADLSPAIPDGFFSNFEDLSGVIFDARLTFSELDLAELNPGDTLIKGTTTGSAWISGKGISPESVTARAGVALSAQDMAADDAMKPLAVTFEAEGSIDGERIRIENSFIRLLDMELSATGTTNLSTKRLDAVVSLSSGNIGRALAQASLTGRGSLRSHARLSGTWDRPEAAITLDSDSLVLEDILLGSVRAAASLGPDGTLAVQDLTLINKTSQVRASGSITLFDGFPGISATLPAMIDVALITVQPAHFMEEAAISGVVDGSVAIIGSLTDPTAHLSLVAGDLRAADFTLDTVQLKGLFSEGALSLEDLNIASKGSSMNARGTIRIMEPGTVTILDEPSITLDVRSETILLEDFTTLAQGTCSLQGFLEGSLLRPSGRMELRGENLLVSGQHLSSVEVRASSDGQRVVVSPVLVVLKENETLSGQGWISFDETFSFRLDSTGIPLNSLVFLDDPDLIEGLAVFEASGSGSIARPEITARLAIRDVTLRRVSQPDWHLDILLRDRTIRAAGSLNFVLDATYELDEERFTASALFSATELSPYFALAGRKDLTGTVSGTLEARGSTRDVQGITMQMDLASIDVFFGANELVRASDLKASFQDGILVLPSSRIILGSQGWMDIQGVGRTDLTLDISAHGILPLVVLGAFVEDFTEAGGSIHFASQIRGTFAEPDLSLLLELQDLSVPLVATGQRIRNLGGTVRISESELLLEKISGTIEAGTFTLEGAVTLEGLSPKLFDLQLAAQSLPLEIPNTLEVSIDAAASIRGTPGASLLAGEIVLLEATYYRDVRINLLTGVSRLLTPERKTPVMTRRLMPEILQNMALQVTLRRRGTVAIDNNIAYLEINPDLLLRGTVSNPVLTGRTTIMDGSVTYQKKEFVVTRGAIDFLNPFRTEATIGISGEVLVRQWTIFLSITGTMDEMIFSLRSDPPEEDAAILSLLAFGKTTREFITGEGGTMTSATGMMAELLASTFGEDIKKATALDIFEVETTRDSTATDNAEGLRLILGKELSRRMTIKYEMETRSSLITQRAIAEYKLLENLLLNGFQDTRGIFGADVQLRVDFR